MHLFCWTVFFSLGAGRAWRRAAWPKFLNGWSKLNKCAERAREYRACYSIHCWIAPSLSIFPLSACLLVRHKFITLLFFICANSVYFSPCAWFIHWFIENETCDHSIVTVGMVRYCSIKHEQTHVFDVTASSWLIIQWYMWFVCKSRNLSSPAVQPSGVSWLYNRNFVGDNRDNEGLTTVVSCDVWLICVFCVADCRMQSAGQPERSHANRGVNRLRWNLRDKNHRACKCKATEAGTILVSNVVISTSCAIDQHPDPFNSRLWLADECDLCDGRHADAHPANYSIQFRNIEVARIENDIACCDGKQ